MDLEGMDLENMDLDSKAGFVTVIGRPNTGKSTLINSLMGSKVTITSFHPNTPRNPIRAILTRTKYQIIFVDTPGIQKSLNALGDRLNEMVAQNAGDTDLLIFTLPADEEIGSGDSYIVKQYLSGKAKFIVAVTKTDKVNSEKLMLKLAAISNFLAENKIEALEIIPITSQIPDQALYFEEQIAKHLPASPMLYPSEISLDQALELTVAEFIREAAIAKLQQELPHSVMVTIEEISKRGSKDFYDIYANLHVERDSQKGILVGEKGSRIKEIGSTARVEIEKFLEAKVFLSIQVKVSKDWQKDPKALARFGFIDTN